MSWLTRELREEYRLEIKTGRRAGPQLTMILCPNCRTIQKAGTNCPLCTCPVKAQAKEGA